MVTVRNTLCKRRHQKRCLDASMKLVHLDFMRTNIHAVSSGKYAETLQETERRQNVGCGLTHIKDNVYEFFLHLEQLRLKYHTIERAKTLKGDILADSLLRIKGDSELDFAMIDASN
jgi:hypothetical protein